MNQCHPIDYDLDLDAKYAHDNDLAYPWTWLQQLGFQLALVAFLIVSAVVDALSGSHTYWLRLS